MEKIIKDTTEKLNNGTLTLDEANRILLELIGVSVSLLPEEPILIGHLNRVFGYNGFKKNEIGTNVFSFKNAYYFEITPLNGGTVAIQNFNKETLAHCIDFISNER
jgi:hypothetical protein